MLVSFLGGVMEQPKKVGQFSRYTNAIEDWWIVIFLVNFLEGLPCYHICFLGLFFLQKEMDNERSIEFI